MGKKEGNRGKYKGFWFLENICQYSCNLMEEINSNWLGYEPCHKCQKLSEESKPIMINKTVSCLEEVAITMPKTTFSEQQ